MLNRNEEAVNWKTMNPINFLFQCLLSILLCYASFVSIYISFIKNRQYDFLTCFFVLTLFIFAVISIKQIYSQIKIFNVRKVFNLNRSKTIVILILCLVSLLAGFFNVYNQYSRGIANPELAQFNMSLSDNLIEASYRQQQPPLDYYFSAFSSSLFGENKLAVRFHAVLFYLILSFILPLGLWFFCSSFWITIVGAILFLFNHVIRLHAVDARSLNLALLTGFIFLFFYLSYCRKNQFKEKSFFPILTSQYLFVLSIGLQPVIFIISLFISSFWLLFHNNKKAFKNLFLSNVIAGLLVLPFYIKMWLFGRSAYKFQEISFESISFYITNLDIFYFIKKYFFIFYEQMLFSFLILTTVLIIVWFIKKSIEKRILILASSLVLFPFFYDPVFNIGLVWNGLHNWYIISFSLLLILFSVLSLKEIDRYLIKGWKVFFLTLFSVVFLWNMYFQILTIKNETRFYFPYRDNSVEKVYDYLGKNGDSKDIVIEFSLMPIVFYRTDDIGFRGMLFHDSVVHPVISDFYIQFTKTPPFFHERAEDKIYYIDWDNIIKNGPQKVFFIVQEEQAHDRAYNVLSSFMKGEAVGQYMIFQWIVSSQDKEEQYKLFLSKINKKPPKKYRGVLYETLLYYAYKNRDRKEFNRLLQEYRNMEMALDEFIPEFKYPSRFELRRRVKYFENLDWDSDKKIL